MPAVTVPPRPKGLPIAITQSPILVRSERPQRVAGRGRSASTLSTAMSVFSSLPTIVASSVVSSERRTEISSASAITWWFVTMKPAGSMMKPEPSEFCRRCCGRCPRRSKNSRKNSSNSSEPRPCSTAWVVEMLTTVGRSSSTRSAKLSGAGLACAGRDSNSAISSTGKALRPAFKPPVARWSIITLVTFVNSRLTLAIGLDSALSLPQATSMWQSMCPNSSWSPDCDGARAQPRSNQTKKTPVTAETRPAARRDSGGTSDMRSTNQRSRSGNSARTSPSITNTSASAVRKSVMAGTTPARSNPVTLTRCRAMPGHHRSCRNRDAHAVVGK